MSSDFRTTRYTHYLLNYHVVWIPKYRRKLFGGEIGEHLEKILRDIADKKDDIEIRSLEVQPDHIHLFLSAPPRYSPSKLVNIFKGASSRRLRNQYPKLKDLDSLWTRTYYVGTAGNVSSETIQRYIEECQNM